MYSPSAENLKHWTLYRNEQIWDEDNVERMNWTAYN